MTDNKFKQYMHIEKLKSNEVAGILDAGSHIYVFPKLDGANGSIWLNENGDICCGSRKRELSYEDDNQGFYKYVQENKNKFKDFFIENKHVTRLFGEWLVPHSIKGYIDTAWREFYCFDFYNDSIQKYLPPDYKLLDKYGLKSIKPLAVLTTPVSEQYLEQYLSNRFLLKENDSSKSEGIVIKNYDYINQYGRITFAKIVNSGVIHSEKKNKQRTTDNNIEIKFIDKYCDEHLIEKSYHKILNEEDNQPKQKIVGKLFNLVYHDLVKEHIFDFIKKEKNPTINFSVIDKEMKEKIKEVMKNELF